MGLKVVTFLGPGRLESRQRQTLRYQFGNYTTKPIRLVGVALFRWLCAEEKMPQEVIIYGSQSSDWDLLHELAAVPYYMPQFQDLGIREALENGTLNADHLDRLGQFLTTFLGGIPVRCRMISERMARGDQWIFFSQLQDHFQQGDELHVDISRDIWASGLFTSACLTFLAQARSVKVRGIYIAQPASTTMAGTPVMIIDDLNGLMDWSNAVTIFRQNGLIGQLTKVFSTVDEQLGRALSDINFSIETFQYKQLYQSFQTLKVRIRALAEQPHPTIAKFFALQLIEELTWLDTGHLADWELEFARRALYSQNVGRAASLIQEAVVTAAISRARLRVDDGYRDHVKQYLLKQAQRKELFPVDPWPYVQLDIMRRALAGDAQARKSKEFQELFASSMSLQRALERAISFAAVLVARFKRVPPM